VRSEKPRFQQIQEGAAAGTRKRFQVVASRLSRRVVSSTRGAYFAKHCFAFAEQLLRAVKSGYFALH
jgi:hypothetical protein